MWREETVIVDRVKQYLPASKKAGRANALVQFVERGPMTTRTVRARDFIEISTRQYLK